MPFLAFLNELSCQESALPEDRRIDAMRGLIKLLGELKKVRTDVSLNSAVRLAHIPLGENLFIQNLKSDFRDEWRFLRSFANRSPLDSGVAADRLSLIDYRYEQRQAIGLGYAHAFDGIGVSFAFDPWVVTSVALLRQEMVGSVIEERTVVVHHAATHEHVEIIRAYCLATPLKHAEDGDDVWINRSDRFPCLKFLARTEAHIRRLNRKSEELQAVNERLWELNAAVSEWNIAHDELPVFKSLVTPEYTNRRELFHFTDLDGTKRYFDLHARFTPGAGRIHFCCNRICRTATIAHVGPKVPD